MNEPAHKSAALPRFDKAFQVKLDDLIRWRRDVRRFRPDALPDTVVTELVSIAALAPSVGNSQPWRFVRVDDAERRRRVIANFEACNKEALGDYEGEQAKLYASLKLAGLNEAPVHLAVFCDGATGLGHGLGRKTMPEMLPYSVVGAVTTLWLAARARSVGVGWVSILDPEAVKTVLEVPEAWALIAYLCVGYPQEEHLEPELQRAGWQARINARKFLIKR
jgi:5,6-dimethylbenzimidazole synthase